VNPRTLRRGCVAIVVLVASAAYLGLGVRSARATPALIGWTAQADANPFDVVVDNATGLAGVHPLVEADLPEDQSDFETGPFGHGLASILWPGATAGNVGSLSGELPLPAQLAPLFGQLNDPVRAESFSPAGPASATYPPGAGGGVAEMTSHADANGASAKAALTDVSLPGLLDVQGAQGATTATASTRASATAAGSVGAVSLLGGLVQIGASSSTVTVSSDGLTPTGKGATHIGAITVAGHPVTVGTDGLVVGSGPATPLAGLTTAVAAVSQLISVLNLKIVLLPQTETHQAPAEKITSGGLQVSFTVPAIALPKLDCTSLGQLSVVCTLPGLLQGASVTVTIARVTATAIATPPFPLPPTAPISPSGPGGGSPSGGGVPPVALPGVVSPAPTGVPAPVAVTPAPGPQSLGNLRPLALSTPVKVGLIVFLLVVAAAIGAALVRMARNLNKPPPSTCLLEGR
jgi:hypothetical protein